MGLRKVTFVLLLTAITAAAWAESGIRIEEDSVVAFVNGKRTVVGRLYESDEPFFGFTATYSYSPAGDAIAFIGYGGGGPGIFVFREGNTRAFESHAEGIITGRTKPAWSPDGTMITFSISDRIWVHDTYTGDSWIVTYPEEDYLEDIDPLFSEDGRRIYFYRGSTFEFSFSGDLYSVGVNGMELTYVPEDYPKYPPEDFYGDEFMDPYSAATQDLMAQRVGLFAYDLEYHDYERLLTYFPGWYLVTQLDMMGYLGETIDAEVFDQFFFNGAVMYDDYSNVIPGLSAIREVLGYEIYLYNMEVSFRVSLTDGREVFFTLMFDPDTLQFSGPFG